MKIGILEDRLSYARDLCAVLKLELESPEITLFDNADDAIDALKNHKAWSLWIVDLMMPSGNGISSEESESGLSTGNRFIEIMSEMNVTIRAGILVITSRTIEENEFQDSAYNIVEMQKGESTQVDIALQSKEMIRKFG